MSRACTGLPLGKCQQVTSYSPLPVFITPFPPRRSQSLSSVLSLTPAPRPWVAVSTPVTTPPPGISGRVWSRLCQAHQHLHLPPLSPSLGPTEESQEKWGCHLAGLSGHRQADPTSDCSPGHVGLWGPGGLGIPVLAPEFGGLVLPASLPNAPGSGRPALGSEMSVVCCCSEGRAGEPSGEGGHVSN